MLGWAAKLSRTCCATLASPCVSCPCLQLPFSGKLCSTTLRNPGAADVVARLHRWVTRLIALVNPLSPAAGGFGGQSTAQVSGVLAWSAGSTSLQHEFQCSGGSSGVRTSLGDKHRLIAVAPSCCGTPLPQDMCCAINTFSLAVLAVIVPLYFAYHSERQARQLFLRNWRRRTEPPAGSSGSSSTSGSEDEPAAAGGATPAALVLGRRRHQRLVQRLEQLQCDPTMAAQHEEEAVAELLRQRRPRPLHWVLAEMLLFMLLAWPLSCLLVEVAGSWMCAAGP